MKNLTELPNMNRNYKDRLFRFIFNDSEKLLSLYNAVNNSHYADPNALEITTIDSVIYLSMKNDISFIIDSTLNLYEHQSTLNPNMPLRGLLYFTKLYKAILEDKNIFSSTLITLPTPSYVVFYNGEKDINDLTELKLSDAFEKKIENPSLECRATMININLGHNIELLNKCAPLLGYSEFNGKIREYLNEYDKDIAVDKAINYCIENNNPISKLLSEMRAEVKNMFLEEYDEEKVMNMFREEGREEGILQVAINLIKKGMDLSFISECTSLDIDTLNGLAASK